MTSPLDVLSEDAFSVDKVRLGILFVFFNYAFFCISCFMAFLLRPKGVWKQPFDVFLPLALNARHANLATPALLRAANV